MNLANGITLGRLVLTAACFVLLEFADPGAPPTPALWWAFALFLVAAATDFVDGWIARRYGQVTPLGRVFDPFADKILICGVLIYLLRFPASSELLKTWMVVVVVAREFFVTTVRGLAESQGVQFPADRLGKIKMVVQSATAAALLTLVAGSDFWYTVAEIGIWATIVLTVLSGFNYLVKARPILLAS